MERRWKLSAFVLLGLLSVLGTAAGCAGKVAIEAPVAAVMDAGGTVVLVDLNEGTVLDTVRMRSSAGDIAADQGAGTFVTAQIGGVGEEADDKIGVIDVRGDRSVRYIDLPRPNPGGVEVTAPGRVLVDHGWMEPEGMFACLVDTQAGKVVRQGYIPDNAKPLRVVDGVAWSSGVDPLSDELSLSRVDARTLASEVVTQGGDFYASIECPAQTGVAGWLMFPDGETLLARFDSQTGAIEATAAARFLDGAGKLVFAQDRLVAVDFSGEDLARTGDRLVVFDGETMQEERAIPLKGGPTDIATWGDRVVVVNSKDETLHVVDPATGAIDRTVELPDMMDLMLSVAVLDA